MSLENIVENESLNERSKKNDSSTETRTLPKGFKVLCANHYTIELTLLVYSNHILSILWFPQKNDLKFSSSHLFTVLFLDDSR